VNPRIEHDDVFVISDLHLSDPREPRLENFLSDEQLKSFVLQHMPKVASGRKTTLVINGDFVDFARLSPHLAPAKDRDVGSTEEESVAKLARSLQGHPRVFETLGKHLAAKNQLIMLAGNHDVDLFWGRVREDLRKALGGSNRLGFCVDTWSLCDRGIYIEHGHQYSYDNRFDRFPPFDARCEHLERCWGTFFMEVIYNQIEYFAPWVNKVHPESRALAIAIRQQGWDKIPPVLVPRLVGFFMAHGKRLLLEHSLGTPPEGGTRADAEALLGSLSGLPAQAMREAEEIARAERSLPIRDPDAEPQPTGALGHTDERGIEKAAAEQLALKDIHTVIFGHTHVAHRHEGGGKATINTGTWTGYIPLASGPAPSFEELEKRAAAPVHRRTYAYVGPGARPGVLETYEG
jgi:UDP-2,3-diacylglucosamine pyrophosphatase LpxH